MRLLSRIALALVVLSTVLVHAESVEPDLHKLLKQAQKPKVHYGPARVGWNGPEVQAQPPANPTYERLRWDSPAAIRRQLRSVLLPQWQFWMAFLTMIVGLRMLRSNRPLEGRDRPSNIVEFPASPPVPRHEAA